MCKFFKVISEFILKKEVVDNNVGTEDGSNVIVDENPIDTLSDWDRAKVMQLYPRFGEQVVEFLVKVREAGVKGGIFMGLRTYAEQDALYAQGRTKSGNIVTNAKGGQSYHNHGIAVDFVFKDTKGNWTWNGDYATIGKIAKQCGLEWGGDWAFVDLPHIQNAYGLGNVPTKLDAIYKKNANLSNPLKFVWEFLDTL